MTVQTHSILIVDDNPESRRPWASCWLSTIIGWKQPAAAGDASGSCRNLYDIVVCDIDMPGDERTDLWKRSARWSRLEVILMTGFMGRMIVCAIRLGADFINKPAEIQHLLKSIEMVTARLIDPRNKVNTFNSLNRLSFPALSIPKWLRGGRHRTQSHPAKT